VKKAIYLRENVAPEKCGAGFLANFLKKVDNSSPTLLIFWSSAGLLLRGANR